jgi:hypothetical protein
MNRLPGTAFNQGIPLPRREGKDKDFPSLREKLRENLREKQKS